MNKLEKELEEKYNRWNHLFIHGGSDPLWSDGCNLSLVRNHIIYIKKQMEEVNKFSELYYKELPPEVDNNYMARVEEIKTNAAISLEIYRSNEDYKYLCKSLNVLTENQIKSICVRNVIGYVTRLEQYITDVDLVAMRRHENPKRYIESFEECRRKIDKILNIKPKIEFKEDKKQLVGQINILDWLGGLI